MMDLSLVRDAPLSTRTMSVPKSQVDVNISDSKHMVVANLS